jgi:hypothetical protein
MADLPQSAIVLIPYFVKKYVGVSASTMAKPAAYYSKPWLMGQQLTAMAPGKALPLYAVRGQVLYIPASAAPS